VSHLPSKTAVRTLVAVTFARLAAPA
jgi:hypothetical protein